MSLGNEPAARDPVLLGFRADRPSRDRATLRSVRIVCPSCKKVLEDVPPDYPPRPFCSPRCKLIDLANWLTESYAISEPAPSVADEDESVH